MRYLEKYFSSETLQEVNSTLQKVWPQCAVVRPRMIVSATKNLQFINVYCIGTYSIVWTFFTTWLFMAVFGLFSPLLTELATNQEMKISWRRKKYIISLTSERWAELCLDCFATEKKGIKMVVSKQLRFSKPCSM